MLIPLFATIAPFVIWPIEIFFPYPHIVEELLKALLIFFLLKEPRTTQKITGTILIGFLFAFTENVLYMFNILSSGNPQALVLRFLLTLPMHVLTSLIILGPALIDKRLIFVGVLIAALIHYLFNISATFIKFS